MRPLATCLFATALAGCALTETRHYFAPEPRDGIVPVASWSGLPEGYQYTLANLSIRAFIREEGGRTRLHLTTALHTGQDIHLASDHVAILTPSGAEVMSVRISSLRRDMTFQGIGTSDITGDDVATWQGVDGDFGPTYRDAKAPARIEAVVEFPAQLPEDFVLRLPAMTCQGTTLQLPDVRFQGRACQASTFVPP